MSTKDIRKTDVNKFSIETLNNSFKKCSEKTGYNAVVSAKGSFLRKITLFAIAIAIGFTGLTPSNIFAATGSQASYTVTVFNTPCEQGTFIETRTYGITVGGILFIQRIVTATVKLLKQVINH